MYNTFMNETARDGNICIKCLCLQFIHCIDVIYADDTVIYMYTACIVQVVQELAFSHYKLLS